MPALSQNCSGFTFTYSTTESRCASTGSILINVHGGIGPFNYRVEGATEPITTSSNIITALPPGTYKVYVQDIGPGGCGTLEQDNIVIEGSYTSPNPMFSKADVSCAGNDGSISLTNITGGRSPFTYTIMPLSASHVGVTNSTGVFTNLLPGEYYIQTEDSCGGLQTRVINILDYSWNFTSVTVNRASCDSADAVVRLQDNKGNSNAAGTHFDGFVYGVVNGPGDTTWFTTGTFRFFIGNRLTGRMVVKDPCGNLFGRSWSIPTSQTPSLGSVITGDYRCDSTFSARIASSTGLTNPVYCLYDSNNTLLACNATGIFTNLSYGSYCIQMTDDCFDTTITRCFTSRPPVPSVAAAVQQSNQTCNTFTARITGQANLAGATYCLVRNDDTNETIACNNTGVFNNVPYGSYCIRIQSNPRCYDTTIIRCFTATRPLPVVNAVSMTSLGCNTLIVDTVRGQSNTPAVRYCLYDANGNIVECNSTGVFSNLSHGNYCIRSVSECGDTSLPYCFNTASNIPTVGNNVARTNRTCNSFTAYISDTSRLVRPLYCLYDANNNLLRCDSTGIFNNLPYGFYCITVTNDPSCYDTTFTRCFTETKPLVQLDATISQSDETCTDFTATVNGTGLTNPLFYLVNAQDDTLASNTTGVFTNVPYGAYCFLVKDGCDTTLRLCQNFEVARGIAIGAERLCDTSRSRIIVQMITPYSPYSYYYYHPDGRLVHSIINEWSSNPRVDLPNLPAGLEYKVVGVDRCGQRDSAFVAPWVATISKTLSVRQKCPSGTWANGSGDLTITSSANPFGRVTPRLIRKDNTVINIGHTTRSGNTHTFLDLEPATYVVEYTVNQCSNKYYDTIVVRPYIAPSQLKSPIYQCEDNSFSVNSVVVNGVGPYAYEITGSIPSEPSVVTGPQTSPYFSINNGTVYSQIDLRVVDACRNAAVNNAHILPLGNVIISRTSNCMFNDVTLSVRSIPNASYQWYKKTSATDSTLLQTGDTTYTIPFMRESDLATYLCKIVVNNSCLTRLAYIDMNGDCGGVLDVVVQLSGKKTQAGNQLLWNRVPDERGVIYTVERKTKGESNFQTLTKGGYTPNATNKYSFLDANPYSGANLYRIKKTNAAGTAVYSNTVVIENATSSITVFPNPVRGGFMVEIHNENATSYNVALYTADGRMIFEKPLFVSKNATATYPASGLKPGTYVLRLTNLSTGSTENRKLLFQ